MKRLLIADDHLMVGNALGYMLSQMDPAIDVVAVGSVDEALERLKRDEPFDLVLLDYDMPGTDGLEGLDLIHRDHPQQTVGVLSGNTEPKLVKAALARGAVGWLPKSMSEEPLLHALRMMAAGGPYVPADVLEQMQLHEDRWGDLTKTESSVAVLVAEGLSDKEVATRLSIAPRTVENHVRSLLRKVGVENRTQFAVAYNDK